MKLPGWTLLRQLTRSGRSRPGQFQAYSHTLPDRYPWLFQFTAQQLRATRDLRLLSFGCSRGDEVLTLRGYFPDAEIKGIDIDPANITQCRQRIDQLRDTRASFAVAATTEAEPTESYDAIFCLAVLCLGDLTTNAARRCDPRLYFSEFERVVTDFSRCLKPSGLLLLHTTNFRFADASVSRDFDTLLEATPEQMAPDLQFGRDNLLLPGPRYRAVAFRKREARAH